MTDRDDLPAPTQPATDAGKAPLPPPRGQDLLPRGTNVGRYVVLSRLGAGAMGVVYAAYDPELDRKVALKLMAPYLRDSERAEEFNRRLLREAQAMARLSHPNVITVYDAGTYHSQVFVAMEFIDGATLRKWLKAEQRPWKDKLGMLLQAGRGLAAAHSGGLIHRDFKPDNVLVGKNDQGYVTDFGIARSSFLSNGPPERDLPPLPPRSERAGSGPVDLPETEAGAVVGTPGYMSPEQLSGGSLDARSDQFCFCIVLYEALYGERPFPGTSLAILEEAMAKGLTHEPPANSAVPAELRRILAKGLSPSPDARYPSMDALLEALSRVKDPAQVRRRQIQTGVALGGLVAVLAGLGYVGVQKTRVCADADAQLTGIWDAPRKQAIRNAFLATGKPYAEDAWKTVERVVDGWASSWVGQRTEACVATKVRHEWSEEIMGLRMVCLERQRKQLSTLTQVFAEADAAAVENAVSAVSALPDARVCGDVVALTSRVQAPDNAALRANVDWLRGQLAEATALMNSGKEPKAFEIAKAVASTAAGLKYPPLEAEALNLRALLEVTQAGDYKSAEKTLLQALWAAESGRHDDAAAHAWTQLINVVGDKLSRPEDGETCARHAESLVKATGGDARLEVELHSQEGFLFSTRGRYAESQEHYQKALALAEKEYPADHPVVASAISDAGYVYFEQGSYEQALDYQQRALGMLEKAFGKAHPRLVKPLMRLGSILNQQGKNAEATEFQRRALNILRGAFGHEHPRVASAMNTLGIALYTQGKYEDALKYLLGALEITEKVLGEGHLRVASILTAVGECLSRQKRFDEALPFLERARRITEKSLGADNVAVVPILGVIGDVERGQHRLPQAMVHYQKAVEIQAKATGNDSPTLAHYLTKLGEAHIAQGQLAKASPILERALAMREHENGALDDLGETQFALAQALWGDKAAHPRARQLASKARENLLKVGSSADAERKQVEAWLATHVR